MKTFEFKIEEKTTYWQTGTVTVRAGSLKKAKELCISGDYEHNGDNYILLDTEGECIERHIIEEL